MKIQEREIPSTLSINGYFNCAKCIQELPEGVSPKEFSRTQIGSTALGLQVWCNRHNCNVVHIDFQGQHFPANMNP